jgi:two-component system sensor histidine kinase HydH
MNAHNVLTLINCFGDLAFALLAWSRRERSAIADPLTLLFSSVFLWGFADLQHEFFGVGLWLAHLFATFMPVLALQVVVVFVGKTRSLRRLMLLAYAASVLIALAFDSVYWWQLLLAMAVVTMGYSVTLLVTHRRRTSDRDERARTELILLAVAIGTIVGTTDLWYNELSFPVPRLSNLGTLVSLGLFAVATLRLRLLGRVLPIVFGAFAACAGITCVLVYLAGMYWFDRQSGLIVMSSVTALLVAGVALREFRRTAIASRERVQRLAGLGRLAEQLAHDLKNPLAALKGGLQFVAVEIEQGRPLQAQASYVELMLEQVNRVNRVVDNYQRIAKVEAICSCVPVNDVVRQVLSLQRFAVVAGVQVRAELSDVLPDCSFDPELVGMALENILRNAYEAMPRGGTVTVRTEAASDVLGVVLRVEDEGSGMDARELERAADEFYTTKPTGTGLGLNFASRVARVHGGALHLTSSVGEGTTVSLCLPASH